VNDLAMHTHTFEGLGSYEPQKHFLPIWSRVGLCFLANFGSYYHFIVAIIIQQRRRNQFSTENETDQNLLTSCD